MGKRRDAAEKMFQAIQIVLDENDDAAMTTPRACKLPSEWRRPLVRAANEFAEVTGRGRGKRRR